MVLPLKTYILLESLFLLNRDQPLHISSNKAFTHMPSDDVYDNACVAAAAAAIAAACMSQ